jgi:hypothetical protein
VKLVQANFFAVPDRAAQKYGLTSCAL